MPRLSDARAQRVALNDPALAPLIGAPDEASRERALEAILSSALPLVRSIVGRNRGTAFGPDDVEDIVATVNLRLVRRLRQLALFDDDAIGNFVDFVATLSYHTIYDFLRSRFPERTRLKNRMRYLLTHNPRLATWNTPSGAMAGLRKWSGAAARPVAALTRENATPAMLTPASPSQALEAILGALGGPIAFDDLVDLVAGLWGVVDRVPIEQHHGAVDSAPTADVRLEARQYLEVLWGEIRALRAPQRAALLLHIRDAEGTSALALLIALGIATVEQVAEVLEIPLERMAALGSDLPLDDLTIAAMLGVTRQQVINLRMAARARLARRMTRAGERRS